MVTSLLTATYMFRFVFSVHVDRRPTGPRAAGIGIWHSWHPAPTHPRHPRTHAPRPPWHPGTHGTHALTHSCPTSTTRASMAIPFIVLGDLVHSRVRMLRAMRSEQHRIERSRAELRVARVSRRLIRRPRRVRLRRLMASRRVRSPPPESATGERITRAAHGASSAVAFSPVSSLRRTLAEKPYGCYAMSRGCTGCTPASTS